MWAELKAITFIRLGTEGQTNIDFFISLNPSLK